MVLLSLILGNIYSNKWNFVSHFLSAVSSECSHKTQKLFGFPETIKAFELNVHWCVHDGLVMQLLETISAMNLFHCMWCRNAYFLRMKYHMFGLFKKKKKQPKP